MYQRVGSLCVLISRDPAEKKEEGKMSENKVISPQILSLKWGRMEVEGVGLGKDFKLWPGGGRSWDWNEHGTDHSGGINRNDCDELLQNGAKVVVLSQGMLLRLKVNQATLSYLRERGVEVVVEGTKKAVRRYNELARSGEAVGGLFHSTC